MQAGNKSSSKVSRNHLRKKVFTYIFHAFALLLVLGASLAAIVNEGLGWSPSPELVSNQVYDATILRFVKHLVDNPQVKLPFLAYEGALWLKSTTAAQVLWAMASCYFGYMIPRLLERLVAPKTLFRINQLVLLSTVPSLFLTLFLFIFIRPIPPPPAQLRHGDWLSGYLQRMVPAFLAGWSVSIDKPAKDEVL